MPRKVKEIISFLIVLVFIYSSIVVHIIFLFYLIISFLFPFVLSLTYHMFLFQLVLVFSLALQFFGKQKFWKLFLFIFRWDSFIMGYYRNNCNVFFSDCCCQIWILNLDKIRPFCTNVQSAIVPWNKFGYKIQAGYGKSVNK